jgi:sugar transferase (PEP-CTERM/EpsH1 system associated)
MRILFLAQRVPYPPDRGDKITTYHEICHLGRTHEVVVACLADGPDDLHHVDALRPWVAAIDAVPLSRARAHRRALAALMTGVPLTVAYFNEPQLHARVQARLRQQRFDAILVYSSGMAQFVEKFDRIPRIMQFADLDSQKWQQFARWSRPPSQWLYRLEARRLLCYERRLAARFDHSVVCTAAERMDFERLIPGRPVTCVGNGTDLEYFAPRHGAKQPHSIVFTGIMDYLPNVDGAVWFCRDILPLIRARVHTATVTICGARPAPAVEALRQIPGVTVTGRVPDVRPFLATASVAVVPLRMARGIQNKLLEAMAMGLPVVATSCAFNGVEAPPEVHALVADEPEPFAAAVARVLTNDLLRTQLGLAARACMERNYRWETQLARLDALLAAETTSHLHRHAS